MKKDLSTSVFSLFSTFTAVAVAMNDLLEEVQSQKSQDLNLVDEVHVLQTQAVNEQQPCNKQAGADATVTSAIDESSVTRVTCEPVPEFSPEVGVTSQSPEDCPQDNFPICLASDFAESAPTTAWLVNGLIPVSGRVMMFGPPGCAKSFLALELLHCLAAGRDFLGLNTKTAKVVYIPYEGLSGVPLRLKALKNEYGALSDNFAIIPATQTLTEADAIDKLAAKVSDCQVICIDTFSASAELDENNNSEINKFLSKVNRLDPKREKTIIMIHHPGHNETGRMRGGLSLAAAADVIIQVSPISDGQSTTKRRSVSITKMKDAAEIKPINFELKTVEIETLEGATTSCVIRKISSHQWPKGIGGNMRIVVRSYLSLSAEKGIEESLLIEHAAKILVEAEGIAISAAKQRVASSIVSLIHNNHMIQNEKSKILELNDYYNFVQIIEAEKSEAAAG